MRQAALGQYQPVSLSSGERLVPAKSGHSLGGSNNLVPFWGIPQKHIVIGIGS